MKASIALLLLPTLWATGATITSSQNGYANEATTWTGGQLPTPEDNVIINNTVTINSAVTWANLAGRNSGTNIYVEDGAQAILTGSTAGKQGYITLINNNWRAAATASMTINGGTFVVKNNGTSGLANFTVANAAVNGENKGDATGTLNINGGSLIIEGFLRIASAQADTTASGTVNLAGGSLYVLSARGDYQVGITSATGEGVVSGIFNWTGGNLAISKVQESLTNTGSGNLIFANYNFDNGTFVGSNGTTQLANGQFSSALTYTQGANAGMTFNIKGTSSYDKLLWYDSSAAVTGNTVDLADGTTITLAITDDASLNKGDVFNIVTADVILIAGEAASNDNVDKINLVTSGDALFNLSVDTDDNGHQILAATYLGIPEPASAAVLLGALALSCAVRRYRR